MVTLIAGFRTVLENDFQILLVFAEHVGHDEVKK